MYISIPVFLGMSLPGMDMVDWKDASSKIDWSAFLICGAATALATVVANLGTGQWLSGILSNLFLSKVAGMGVLVLLLVINLMMAVGTIPCRRVFLLPVCACLLWVRLQLSLA